MEADAEKQIRVLKEDNETNIKVLEEGNNKA